MKFYRIKLEEIPNDKVISEVYPERIASQLTLEERIGSGKCNSCDKSEWGILPKDNPIVLESGKPYIICLNCGSFTHL